MSANSSLSDKVKFAVGFSLIGQSKTNINLFVSKTVETFFYRKMLFNWLNELHDIVLFGYKTLECILNIWRNIGS